MSEQMVVASLNDYPVQKYNRLFPATLTQLSPLHKVMVNVVSIDPVEGNGEVYKQKTGGLSLTKVACLKLMTASNVVMEESKPIMPKACQRCIEIAKQIRLAPQCGGCETKNDVAYQVSILVPEPSGGHRRYIASKEVSRAEFVAKNGGEGKAPVEHMAAQCETKALLRALRAALGLKGSYTPQELGKPFAVALVVLNTTDPELKHALIQRYATGHDALFGSTPQLVSGSDLQLPSGAVEGEMIVMGDDPAEDYYSEEGDRGENPGADDDTPPWQQSANVPTCEECARIIEASGSWTVEKIVDYSKRQYGKVLCPTCQLKRNRGGAR